MDVARQQIPLAVQARLFQFASQALPTGSYAYSNGLEALLDLGLLRGEESCARELTSLLRSTVVYLEIPLFSRMYNAARDDDRAGARRVSLYLLASRESREFQEQEQQMGKALHRVLRELCPEECRGHGAQPWVPETYTEALAFAAAWYGFSLEQATTLLVFNWVEQQVTALSKLLPLGPLAGQRMLDALLRVVPEIVESGLAVPEEQIGCGAPLLALASGLHEHQYCRIFRS